MNPRFSLEEISGEQFKFTIHDSTIDEPVAWCMDRYEAELILKAMNKEYPPNEEEAGETLSP